MATATRRPPQRAERLVAEVLEAQGRFFDAARRPSEAFLEAAIEVPGGFDPLAVEKIREAQLAYQAAFQRKSAKRLRSGLLKAMDKPTRLTRIRELRARQRASTDPDVRVRLQHQIEDARLGRDERRDAVAKLLETEHRLARAHALAMAGRARAASRATQVRQESPTGALWRRDPQADSCERCRFMDGKLWPWEVLERFSPPVHPNCRCQLIPIGAAKLNGWVGAKAKVPTPKQAAHRARRVLQESASGLVLLEIGRRGLWREGDVDRDRLGRFDDEPGVSIGRPFDQEREASPTRAWLDTNADDVFKASPAAMDYAEFWGDWSYQDVTVKLTEAAGGFFGPVVKGHFVRDGQKVGEFMRYVDEGSIKHEMIQAYKGAPRGTGTQFVRDTIDKARADDRIDRIDFEASWASGGYVWAREGGIPNGDWEKLQRSILRDRIGEVKAAMPQGYAPGAKETQTLYAELYTRLEEGSFESIQEVAAFGRERAWGYKDKTWLGKKLLAGSDWKGHFDTRSYAMAEMLSGLELYDLSKAMGLMLPPDEPDADDREFWDRAEGLRAVAEELSPVWREDVHPRDLLGRFKPKLASFLGRRAHPAAPNVLHAQGLEVARASSAASIGYRGERREVPLRVEAPGGGYRDLSPEETEAEVEAAIKDLLDKDPGVKVEDTGAEGPFNPARLAEVYDGFEHGGLRVRVNFARSVGEEAVELNADVLNERGEAVGNMVRNLGRREGEPFAYHNLFQLDDAYQGRGLGAALNEHAEASYRKLGVTQVRLDADGVGGYAWARAGFEIEDRARMKTALHSRVWDVSRGLAPPREFDRRWPEFLEFVGARPQITRRFGKDVVDGYRIDGDAMPGSIADVAAWGADEPVVVDGRQMWPGKWFLLGLGWPGVKRL